ncbi:MAG: hypothetical protein WCL51_07515 [Bacteroidota bacterium]
MENQNEVLQNYDRIYEKPRLMKITTKKEIKISKRKLIVRGGIIVFSIYVLMLLPLFFLYPNYNQPIKENFDPKWLINISNNIQGDCFRKARNFIKECPFPCREVHLNSEHTIVEIMINQKWIAFDPVYNLYFDDENVVQISSDINRGYTPPYLAKYPYKDSFKKFRYYHNTYFAILNKTHPYYYKILRLFYTVISR